MRFESSQGVELAGSVTLAALATVSDATIGGYIYGGQGFQLDEDCWMGQNFNGNPCVHTACLSAATSGTELKEMYFSPTVYFNDTQRIIIPEGDLFLFKGLVQGKAFFAGIRSITIVANGTGYTDGDVIALIPDLDQYWGQTPALFTVDPVSPTGGVTGVTITASGNGFRSTNLPGDVKNASGGTGAGCTMRAASYCAVVVTNFDCAAYEITGLARRDNSGNYSILTQTLTDLYESNPAWNVVASAKDSTYLAICVSAQNNVLVRWTGTIQIVNNT